MSMIAKPWPHAPPHILSQQGVYMVTSGTYHKEHFFKGADRLNLLRDNLLTFARENGWTLHAWAVFSNHYHLIAQSPSDASDLGKWLARLHQQLSATINREDNTPNRKVWYQYWDSRITFHKSYLARLAYVHQNPVKHGLATIAAHYPWCSAGDFEAQASKAFVKSIYAFDTSKINILDEF